MVNWPINHAYSLFTLGTDASFSSHQAEPDLHTHEQFRNIDAGTNSTVSFTEAMYLRWNETQLRLPKIWRRGFHYALSAGAPNDLCHPLRSLSASTGRPSSDNGHRDNLQHILTPLTTDQHRSKGLCVLRASVTRPPPPGCGSLGPLLCPTDLATRAHQCTARAICHHRPLSTNTQR